MAKISLYLDTRSGKDEFPVKLRISHRKETTFVGTGIKVAPYQWNGKEVMGHKKAKSYNSILLAYLGQAESIIANLRISGTLNKYTAVQIKQMLENGGEVKEEITSHNFYEYYLAAMNAKAKAKTRSSYEQALVNLAKFDSALKDRTFEEIDYKYMERFDKWFESRGVTVNSRGVYYRNIRAVFNDAIDDGLTNNYPFKRFKIKKTPTKKRNLSIEQLRLLHRYPIEDKFKRKYRDLFMLMFYLRGINAVDLFGLKESNIRLGRIEYIRSKTGKPYSIKIEPEMQEIIDRYKGEQYLIDVCDGAVDLKDWTAKYEGFLHRMDRGLKKIGPYTRKPGRGGKIVYHPIHPKISQYWCRHTTATLMVSMGVSNDFVACSLGHDHGNKTTNIYIEYGQDEVDKANRALIDYVNEK